MKKAQSAIEFLIVVGFMMFVLVTFISVINHNLADKRYEEKNNIAKEIALNVQNEISLASNSLDGYQREFTLPLKVGNLNYQINIQGSLVYLETENVRHALAYPVLPVTGDLIVGKNIIRKNNGIVYLNQ